MADSPNDKSEHPIIEGLFGHEKVSQELFNYIYSLAAGGGLLVLYALYSAVELPIANWFEDFFSASLGIGFIILAVTLYDAGLTNVQNNPPHVALLSIWGRRLTVLIGEGKLMAFRFWPFYIDYLQVPVEKFNFDFPYDKIPCASRRDQAPGEPEGAAVGGSVKARVSITGTANDSDAREIIKYLNHGGKEKIKSIINDHIDERLREIAGHYDWERFTFLKDSLTVMLLVDIANIDFRQLDTGPDGLLVPAMFMIEDKDDYAQYPKVYNPKGHLFPMGPDGWPLERDETEKKRIQQEIEIFLYVARESCFLDVMDLGIKITRLNVTHVQGSDEQTAAAEKAAAEVKERQGESYDTDTNIRLAHKYVEASRDENGNPTVSFNDALKTVQTDKGRAQRFIIEGSAGDMTTAAAVFSANKH